MIEWIGTHQVDILSESMWNVLMSHNAKESKKR